VCEKLTIFSYGQYIVGIRIWQQIDIDDMQFVLMKGKGTTDAIFIVRQMQEKFRAKGKKLYFVFVDLEKAFDRLLIEVIGWAMHKLGVEEWLVSEAMSMYTGTKTVVRTVHGKSNGFEVKVGMQQGSALSPLLFVIVMVALSSEFKVALPWELLYTDDLIVIAETEDDLIKRLNEWKDFVENRGMRVNMNKPYGHDASRLQGCHLDIRAQIQKSRCESMRMSMESIVPKY